MNRDSRTLTAVVGGAVLGGLTGYLFFTEHGRGLRRQTESAVDDFVRELNEFRFTLQRAIDAASESWSALNDMTGTERRARGSNVS